MNDKLKLKGKAIIELRKKDGTVIEREEIDNLIVNTGKQRVAELIGGASSDYFGVIGIGTGTNSPSVSDTELQTEVVKEVCDSGFPAYEADYKITFEATFSFASGDSYAITEAGIFDGAGSGAIMLDRFTFSAKNVDVDTGLWIQVKVTVS
jgi:hypothetical protein